jgi:energy-coupling factor transport system permease protein
MRGFSTYHPVAVLIYFVMILMITMFLNIPVLLLLSLSGAWLYNLLSAKGSIRGSLLFDMVFFLIFALSNPIFTHRGSTILFFLNGKPVTLEAVIYGLCMAIMMVGVINWCRAFTRIMTSDKLLYLCGKLTPNLSVVLSMVLRYIPLFKIQATKVENTQTAMGLYVEEGHRAKARGSMRIFSIVLTWSLENAIDTANSMKARGYGMGKRSQFSIFRWNTSDLLLLMISVLLAGFVLYGSAIGQLSFVYYPELSKITTTPEAYLVYLACGLLAYMPLLLELKEKLKWKLYRSRI